MTTSAPAGLLVAELAAAAGVGPDTIGYDERAGLLAPPPRTSGGYRRFPPETVDRPRFIQGCQRLGCACATSATCCPFGTTECARARQIRLPGI
ncbi:MerR family DNA-binding transcriptional regulator [Actinophytocola sp.]|uniref:MerR family DNA-binding transcriptional regulator n=1 Tax=Actinophytocola sp. TaxID=1872138 RepID=UPI003D6C4F8D